MDAHKTLKQTAQCNTYQPRPPQGTSDVARGEGPTEKLKNAALKKEKQRRVKRQLGNKLPIIYVIKGLSKRPECTINSITEEITILFSV